MERDKPSEAARVFETAYALDSGQSDAIRDNLRRALAKSSNPGYSEPVDENFSLVRRGTGEYLLLTKL